VELEKQAWQTNVNDSFGVLEYVIKDIQQLATKEGTRAEIIKKGQDGLDRAREDYPRLVAKRDELYKTPTAAEARELKPLNEELKRMSVRIEELSKFVGTQKDIEKQENDPAKLEWKSKVEQGKLLENELEYGKAIALYEALPTKFDTKEELKNHIADLHKRWDSTDQKFLAARTFIYEVVPNLKDSAAVQARLSDMVAAFDACKNVKDVIAAQKLLSGIGLLLPRLAKEGEALNPINVEEEAPIKRLKDVGASLEKLVNDLKEYLGQQKPPEK